MRTAVCIGKAYFYAAVKGTKHASLAAASKPVSVQDDSKSTRTWTTTFEEQNTAQYAWQSAQDSLQATWHDVLSLGAADTAKGRKFRDGLVCVLKQCPHKAIYFECNPVRADQVKNTPFLMTLLNSPSLAKIKTADPQPFSKQLLKASAHSASGRKRFAAAFPNLSGDSVLIVPTGATTSLQTTNLDAYAHLMAFVRRGGAAEVDAFWKAVFQQMTQQLRQNPQTWIWLSTSGDGVSWLHMRCDTTPKYYRFKPFKTVSYAAATTTNNV
jgi:hypothetical protein